MMCRTLLAALFVVLFPHLASSQTTPNTTDQIKAVLEEIKRKGALKLSATTDQSAIEAASLELKKLSKIDVAASIDESGANMAIAQQLKTNGRFKNPKFTFAKQAADGTIQYAGPASLPGLGAIDIAADLHARMAASVEIDPTRQSTDFKVGFSVTALEVLNLKISRDGKPVSGALTGVAEFVINGILLPAQTLLNHLELRLPTTISAQIELKPSQKPGLSTKFEPGCIAPKLTITGLSHIIDNGRIIAVLQEGGTSNNVADLPKNSDIAAFRGDFQGKLASSGITWMNQGRLSVYVNRELIKSLTSRVMSSGPICMAVTANDLPMPFGVKVKLPQSEVIDCSPTRDCTPKRECRQNIECAQTEECRRCKKAFGKKVCWNDPGCEFGKKTRKAACESGKEARERQCEAEKIVEKATCEALKTSEKAACEGFKETYDRVRATGADYANVDSKDLLLNGGAKVCLNELSFEPKELRLTGKLQVEASARATGHVKFTPLKIVGHASCFAPVEKALAIPADLPLQTIDIDTSAKFLNDSSQLTLEARIVNPVRFRLPFATVTAKLATDPKFAMLCPVPGTAATIRAITPDSWWPRQARGDLERELPAFKLELDLVKKPLAVNGLAISGRLQSAQAGIGGVFSLAPMSKPAAPTKQPGETQTQAGPGSPAPAKDKPNACALL